MHQILLKTGPILKLAVLVCLFPILFACDNSSGGGGDSGTVYTAMQGLWTGEGVSLVISENGDITNLTVTYAGLAEGTLCDYSYENTISAQEAVSISENTASYEEPPVSVRIVLTGNDTMTLDLSWSEYTPYCDAWETGSQSLDVYYQSLSADPPTT